MTKIKTAPQRIKMAPTALEAHGVKMARKPAKRTGRDADSRRTLPLNSAAWQRLRASVLAGEPLCRMCQAFGFTTEATDVDHINGDPGDNSTDNLQPLCHECHSLKTAADHGKAVNLGCDVSGMPLDPNHPWNREVPALLQKSQQADRARPTCPPSFNAHCLKNRQL